MAGNGAIWRDAFTEPSGGSADKIEFDEGTVPDNTSHITQTEIEIISAIAVNEKPKGNINEIQDTFVDSVSVIITGSIQNPKNVSTNNPFKTVKKWLLDKKTVDGTFPKGRFGLRLNDFPHFDMKPTSSRAYILHNWRWIREGEWSGRVAFVAILRFNGDIGASPYNWG